MANNKRPTRSEEWREKIKIGVLIDRLNNTMLGTLKDCTGKEIELTTGQIKCAEILLRKTIPDLKAMELYGKDGGAIETKDVSDNDQTIINQYFNNKKELK